MLRAGLLAASLALAVLLAEVVLGRLRPAAPRRAQGSEPKVAAHDPLLGWSLVPGASGRHRTAEFDVAVRVNSQGFRADRAYSPEAPPGTLRIVAVGDSFTFGQGVEVEETFAARLEGLLPGTEVVNLGVSGYGTDQQLLMLRHRGLAFRPDVVLLGLLVTNVLRNDDRVHGPYAKPVFRLGPDGRLALANVPVPAPGPEPSPRPGLLGRSRLARFVRDRLEYGGFGKAWPLTAAILRETVATSRQAGARLVVLLIPTRDAVEGSRLDRWRQARMIRRVAGLVPRSLAEDAEDAEDTADVEVLDLAPALIARFQAAPREPLFYARDGHLTAAGHAVAAAALARHLTRRVLSGGPRASRAGPTIPRAASEACPSLSI